MLCIVTVSVSAGLCCDTEKFPAWGQLPTVTPCAQAHMRRWETRKLDPTGCAHWRSPLTVHGDRQWQTGSEEFNFFFSPSSCSS